MLCSTRSYTKKHSSPFVLPLLLLIFKGLCSILLAPFISQYEVPPAIQLFLRWNSLQSSDLPCHPSLIFVSSPTLLWVAADCGTVEWGWSILFLTIIDILWGLIAEPTFLHNSSQKVILRHNPSVAWDTPYRYSSGLCTLRQNEIDKGGIFLQWEMWPMWQPHTVMFLRGMQCLNTSIPFLWSCNHLRALKESWEECSCLSTGISCCFRHMVTAQSWHTGHELHNELTLSRRNTWRSSTFLKAGHLNPALLRAPGHRFLFN